MTSSRETVLTDLEKDIPTTEGDVEVLRRLRSEKAKAPFDEQQKLVDQLPPAARKQSRSTSEGWVEFTL